MYGYLFHGVSWSRIVKRENGASFSVSTYISDLTPIVIALSSPGGATI